MVHSGEERGPIHKGMMILRLVMSEMPLEVLHLSVIENAINFLQLLAVSHGEPS
jgi:hypothetical protein